MNDTSREVTALLYKSARSRCLRNLDSFPGSKNANLIRLAKKLVRLLDSNYDYRFAWASQAWLAKKEVLGISERHIIRLVGSLRKLKLFEIKKFTRQEAAAWTTAEFGRTLDLGYTRHKHLFYLADISHPLFALDRAEIDYAGLVQLLEEPDTYPTESTSLNRLTNDSVSCLKNDSVSCLKNDSVSCLKNDSVSCNCKESDCKESDCKESDCKEKEPEPPEPKTLTPLTVLAQRVPLATNFFKEVLERLEPGPSPARVREGEESALKVQPLTTTEYSGGESLLALQGSGNEWLIESISPIPEKETGLEELDAIRALMRQKGRSPCPS